MQAHNLCYSTLLTPSQARDMDETMYTRTPNGHCFVNQTVREGILPEILTELLSARKRAKKDMKAAKDKLTKNVMNGRQLVRTSWNRHIFFFYPMELYIPFDTPLTHSIPSFQCCLLFLFDYL